MPPGMKLVIHHRHLSISTKYLKKKIEKETREFNVLDALSQYSFKFYRERAKLLIFEINEAKATKCF